MPKPLILLLPADPMATDRLALEEERAAIVHEMQRSDRDVFDLRVEWASSIDDLMRHLLDYEPTVIHFSGHDGGRAGLTFDNDGIAQRLSPHVLSRILEAAPSTRLVVLNACFDDELANALT
jgi:hypothetical protein